MIIGPVFTRELQTSPRRPRHFIYRGVYVLTLLITLCTAWLVVIGTQVIRNVGDIARFGAIVFQIIAPLQLALLTFLAAFGVASAVAQEKDRRTLILLLMTRLTNSELVLGKMLAALLDILVLLLAALPLFLLVTLLGGISYSQVIRVFAVTATTLLAAGSLGGMFALWREKTFQALSMTALTIGMWIGFWEAVHSGLFFETLANGWSCQDVATAFSPLRAVLLSARPRVEESWLALDSVNLYVAFSFAIMTAINAWSVFRVRVWNPSREVFPIQQEQVWQGSIWGDAHDVEQLEHSPATPAKESPSQAEIDADRARHIDSYRWKASRPSREVWNNPILWREVRTRAYGRKMLVIQLGYVLLWLMAGAALHWTAISGGEVRRSAQVSQSIPEAAQPLAPFFLISLVIINALAVNSITNERDAQALDLLLVSDISPIEFILGKLSGVMWVTKLMVLGPILLAGYLCWAGGISFENLCYLLIGLVVMNVFAATLGIHCGVNYANSRSAISISLGTVFFLFVGVVTCLIIMVSFSGSFQVQYAPFLTFIGGGSIGLFVALGIRNPSPAILCASTVLPIATFFALVSFVLGHRELTICLVIGASYGFTIAAMLVPAISEFDFAMGRTKLAGDE